MRTALQGMRVVLSFFMIFTLLAPDAAYAARRYWVGAYGGTDWHDVLNWSTAQGGGGGASVPGINDVAIFHPTNSGNTITIKNSATAGGIILAASFTGIVRTGTSNVILGGTGARIGSGYFIIGTGAKLSSSGSWTQTGGVVYNVLANHVFRISGSLIVMRRARFRYSGTIVFNSANADQTLAFSGSRTPAAPSTQAVGRVSFSGITLANTAGTTADDLHVSGSLLKINTLTVTQGNFELNGGTSDTVAGRSSVPLAVSGAITLANNASASLSTDANITASGKIWVHDSAVLSVSGGTLTLNGGIDQILDLDGQKIFNLTINNRGGGSNDDIIASGGTLQLSGALTVTLGNLDLGTQNVALISERGITLADAAQATFTTDQNMTVSGTILVNDAATLTVTTGSLVLNDTGDQSVDFDGQQLAHVTINNAGGGTDDDVTIAGGSLLTRGLTITLGNLDLETNSLALSASGSITIANTAQATLTTNSNIRMSGSLTTGAAGGFIMSAGRLTMNGVRQDLDVSGAGGLGIHDLTIRASSGVYLTSYTLVKSSLLVHSGSVLTFAANKLALTGGTVTNYGTIRENTGMLYHTGSLLFIANSSYIPLAEFKSGDTMYFTLTESDENIDGTTNDTQTVTVSIASGDSETVTLTETYDDSGVFRGSIVTKNAEATSNDGTLQATADKTVTATVSDAQDGVSISDTTVLTAVGSAGSTSGTNSGGGSSRSRGSGGGGGNKSKSTTKTPVKGVKKPARRVPAKKKMVKKKTSKKADAKGKAAARKAARRGR